MLATGVLAALPVISSTVKAEQAGWVPAGDDGIIATRGWDVLTSHTPLVGQYSEAGLVIHGQVMHSPGPMLYWLLALPARYSTVGSLAITMCVLNTLAIIVCVALARRRGGLPLMFAAAFGISLMCQSLPGEAMHDIWNPAAALFPFLALIFIGWSLACGEYRLLPLAALVASFVLQTHLMYLAPTLVVGAVGLGGPGGVGGRAAPGRSPCRAGRSRWGGGAGSSRAASQRQDLAVGAGGGRDRVRVLDAAGHQPARIQPREPHDDRPHGRAPGPDPGDEHRLARPGARGGGASVVAVRAGQRVGAQARRARTPRARPAPTRRSRSSPRSALVLLLGALRRRWDLCAATLIALGLCAAMVEQVANNPASQLLAETPRLHPLVGLGARLLGVSGPVLGAVAGPQRQPPVAPGRAPRPECGCVSGGVAGGGLRRSSRRWPVAGLAGLALVGTAVASEERPDSHVYEYRSVTAMAKALERVLPAGQGIDYRFGALDLGTQPMEPALRFLLVRHGDRVMAPGSFPRLGSYYELSGHPYEWVVYLTDGTRPAAHMRLASRVSFRSPWGQEVLSAWVRRVRPTGVRLRGPLRRPVGRAST